MAVLHALILREWKGVFIRAGSHPKRSIEKLTRAKVDIDPEDEEIMVSAPDEADPGIVLKARDIVIAIGRGFSPERAFRLLRDDSYLGLVDIKGVSGKRGKKSIWRIRSRLIGENGRARERLEELSGCFVSIYGNTVALI